MTFKALHWNMKPLGLEVSWAETKIQMFGVCRLNRCHIVACDEDPEILENFKYLGCVVHNYGGPSPRPRI